MNLVISRESIKKAIEVMPASTGDYLDLLMAPVFTDEKLSAAEYEDIIASAYGKTIVAELRKSGFTLTVRCPSAVHSAKASAPGTATFSGSSAVIKIPPFRDPDADRTDHRLRGMVGIPQIAGEASRQNFSRS